MRSSIMMEPSSSTLHSVTDFRHVRDVAPFRMPASRRHGPFHSSNVCRMAPSAQYRRARGREDTACARRVDIIGADRFGLVCMGRCDQRDDRQPVLGQTLAVCAWRRAELIDHDRSSRVPQPRRRRPAAGRSTFREETTPSLSSTGRDRCPDDEDLDAGAAGGGVLRRTHVFRRVARRRKGRRASRSALACSSRRQSTMRENLAGSHFRQIPPATDRAERANAAASSRWTSAACTKRYAVIVTTHSSSNQRSCTAPRKSAFDCRRQPEVAVPDIPSALGALEKSDRLRPDRIHSNTGQQPSSSWRPVR